jgi:hypothetical protein
VTATLNGHPVAESTGHEINAAMDRHGEGTGPWAAISRPSRR